MRSKLKSLFLMPDRINILIISLFFIACTFFSALIPPFQSPDEYDHIKRSYLLSKGTIILNHPQGQSSGGMIDSGLLAYMNAYPVTSDKLSSSTIDSADCITWTGIKIFSPAPGTGYYFPLIYMPQATGLAIGEKLGLTIDSSYRLARLITLIAVAGIILAAFSVYPVNPLVVALIVMPMSMFQFSSASLDGISTGLSIFSIAAFLKIGTDKEKASRWLFYALTTSVILLATSRVHLLPLLALVLIPCFYFKKKKYYFVFSFSLLAVLAWLIIAIKTTVDLRVVIAAPTLSIALFYINHPMAFARVLLATLSDGHVITFYYHSFFGILGWLDTPFRSEIYDYLLDCFALIGLLSISTRSIKKDWAPRSLLIVLSFSSILLIFFALLVTASPHPATIISGVQGRYFLVPVIMLAYAISGNLKLDQGAFRKIALLFCIALFVFTISGTTKLLLDRYYLVFKQPKRISLSIHPSDPVQWGGKGVGRNLGDVIHIGQLQGSSS